MVARLFRSAQWLGLVGLVGIPSIVKAGAVVQAVSVVGITRPALAGGNGDSSDAVLSANGRWVVFASAARNLLSQPGSGHWLNTYARDRRAGVTLLASPAVDGNGGGDGDSLLPSVSADGRYVAFASRAQNLVTNATSGAGDIFVRDLRSGSTVLVSVRFGGTVGGNGPSSNPQISPDGRYVLFDSVATDLVTNLVGGVGDVYLRDLLAGTTSLISVDPAGSNGGSGPSQAEAMSTNAARVVFTSSSSNLLPTPNVSSGVLVRDLTQGVTFNPVVTAAGTAPTRGSSFQPRLSANGRYLAFLSTCPGLTTNLVSANLPSLYWRDLQSGTNLLVGAALTNSSIGYGQFTLSATGQRVAYSYTNQVFAWDASTQTTTLISADTNGAPASGVCGGAVISADGGNVAFVSTAPGLVNIPCPGSFQVFVRDLTTGSTTLASVKAGGLSGSQADCLFPALSDEGGVVAFETLNSDLAPNDANGVADIFIADMNASAVELISTNGVAGHPLTTAAGVGAAPLAISSDGRYVLFTSAGEDLVAKDTNHAMDVFLRDRFAGTNILVSVGLAGTGSGNNASTFPTMTPNGRFVAFISRASDLAATGVDSNGFEDVYARDLTQGSTVLVSVTPAGLAAGGVSSVPPAISVDGRFVAFASLNRSIVTNPVTSGGYVVYLRDLQGLTPTVAISSPQPTFALVSEIPLAITPGPRVFVLNQSGGQLLYYDSVTGTHVITTNHVTGTPAVTPDGRFVTYWLGGAAGAAGGLYVYDLANNSVNLLLSPAWLATGRVPIQSSSWALSISDDGRYVAFVDGSDTLDSRDHNRTNDVYVIDRLQPDQVVLASVDFLGSSSGDGASDSPRLSSDGRLIAFRSFATDLWPGVTGRDGNIFVRDWREGITYLLSTAVGGQGGASGRPFAPIFSADVSSVVFASDADNLVDDDLNQRVDVFQTSAPSPSVSDPALPLEVQRETNGVSLHWLPAGQRVYQVQFKNELEAPLWQALPASISSDAAGRLRVEDTGFGGQAHRYYRVLSWPQTGP